MTETRKRTRAASRRRRRLLISSLITTFVLIFGWIGVMVGLQMLSGSGSSFRDETLQVLEGVRDGKVSEVYQAASPIFRKRISLDAFRDVTADIDDTLGGFREILSSRTVEMIDGPGGKTGRVHASLAFEHGKTNGRFSYHLVDGGWRLLGLSIDLPVAAARAEDPEAARAEPRGRSLEAPSEVLSHFGEILELGRDGQGGRIYDEAAPPLQESIERDAFIALLKQRSRSLGSYLRVLEITRSWQNRGRTRARVTARVQFARAETTVSMSFVRLEGIWRLSYYKVVIPRPSGPD